MDFKNIIVDDYLKSNNLQIINSDPHRPWGGWYMIDINSTSCYNDSLSSLSDKKIIRVIPGSLLSLQYHGSLDNSGHDEIWETCTKTRAIVSKKSVIGMSKSDFEHCLNDLLVIDLDPSAKIVISAGFIHALVNPYDNDLFVIETRISQKQESSNDRENNITRIYDQYNRSGTSSYPSDLLLKIMDKNFKPDVVVPRNECFYTNL